MMDIFYAVALAKSPVTLDDCKTEKYNRIANEFNILI